MSRMQLLVLVTLLFGLGLAPGQGADTGSTPPSAEVTEATLALGGELFAEHCAQCHAPDGTGRIGPALTDPVRVATEDEVIGQVLRGSLYMPPFAGKLDDQQVAAVVTFVRNSFGHSLGPTTPEEVAEER